MNEHIVGDRMRYRMRLQMNIVPILLLSVLIVTLSFITLLTTRTDAFQENIMRYRLRVVYEFSKAEYDTLERVNLLESARYVNESKERIFDFIEGTEIPGGHFRIFDSDGEAIYVANGEKLIPEQDSARQGLSSGRSSENTLIRYQIGSKDYLIMYDYLESWDWYIVVVADRSIVYKDVDRAVLLSVLYGFIAVAVALFSIHLITRSISKPVENMTQTALAMRDGEYSARVSIESEDELGELAEAFNSMAKDIEDNFTQIRAKSESLSLLASFAAGMAHDLKTPLGNSNTVISYMDKELNALMQAYEDGKLSNVMMKQYFKEATDAISILTKNMNQATELVSGYKTVSVDQLNREKRWVDLYEYIDEIIHTLKPRIRKANVIVENRVDEDIHIWTYPGAISQIMTNLILNSIVHGFENTRSGKIEIEARREDPYIVVIYRDDGSGISEENIQHIYDAFFTTKHDKGGSGLGMHIIYNLVKSLLGGTVKCESKLGEGVRFTIVFPDESHIS